MKPWVIDVKFEESDSTPKRLIKVTQVLVSQYGYDAISTRTIAQLAGVSLSSINFHFGSKEALVKEAVVERAEALEKAFKPINDEIEAFLDDTPIDKEKGWDLLNRYVAQWINLTYSDKSSQINIGIIEHENGFPEEIRGIMATSVVRHGEVLLAKLLYAISDKPDKNSAFVMARSFHASVMTFVEKPLLTQAFVNEMSVDYTDEHSVEDYLLEFVMSGFEGMCRADIYKQI